MNKPYLPQRLLSKVKFDEETYCWVWKGAKSWAQYGIMYLNGKLVTAHRISYMLFKGEIQRGLVIDHLCGNHSCVNPDHLEAVTQAVNCTRGTGFSAANKAKRYCPKGHLLEGDNLSQSDKKRGKRSCKTCLYSRHELTKFRKTITLEWCN